MSEWGWNPESFAAAGTVSAALIGAVALLIAAIQVRVVVQDRKDRQTDQERQQASLISVRYLRHANHGPGSRVEKDEHSPDAVVFNLFEVTPLCDHDLVYEIINSSGAHIVIHGLVVEGELPFRDPIHRDRFIYSHSVGAGWTGRKTHIFGLMGFTLKPGSLILHVPLKEGIRSSNPFRLAITFSDARRENWVLWFDGKLDTYEALPSSIR